MRANDRLANVTFLCRGLTLIASFILNHLSVERFVDVSEVSLLEDFIEMQIVVDLLSLHFI